MRNVDIKVQKNGKGRKLIITCDLEQELGLSKSGKTMIIATSSGNQQIPDTDEPTYLGLNLYKYTEPRA